MAFKGWRGLKPNMNYARTHPSSLTALEEILPTPLPFSETLLLKDGLIQTEGVI
jgi:hypothetical protein